MSHSLWPHELQHARLPCPLLAHSGTLAWRVPWIEEPGGLQSMESLVRTRLNGFIFTFHFHALEKEMATHSNVLAWRIPGWGNFRLWGRTASNTTGHLHFHFSLSCIREGNGNPLQCSCLQNPRDSGAWGAAVYGIAQSRTLKRLSSSSNSRPFLNLLYWLIFLLTIDQFSYFSTYLTIFQWILNIITGLILFSFK